jgi:uncharacterized protein
VGQYRFLLVSAPPEESILLRIFVRDGHRYQHLPLFEAIVLAARKAGLSGATALHGILGFGRSTALHQGGPSMPMVDRPVVIEVVDSPTKIEAFLPVLDAMMSRGLITMERARVLSSTASDKAKQ